MPLCRYICDYTWDASGQKKKKKNQNIFVGADVWTGIVSSTEIKSSVVKRLVELKKIRKEKT